MTYRASRGHRASERVRKRKRQHLENVSKWHRSYETGTLQARALMRRIWVFMYGPGYELPLYEDRYIADPIERALFGGP